MLRRKIASLVLVISAAMPTADLSAQQPTVADFVKSHDRVLHGFGQGLHRFEPEAIPYFQAIEEVPVFYSTYLKLAQIRLGELERLEQIRHFSRGWTDEDTGITYPFVPILGVNTVSVDVSDRRDSLSAAFFDELGITEDVMDRYGLGAPRFSLDIFPLFLNNPDLWSAVKDTLRANGLSVDDIDLEELLEDGSDEAVYRLIALRDSVIVLANRQLLDRGFPFADLAVNDGAFDAEIAQLGDSIAAVGSPVLVRFLYETIQGVSRPFLFSSETYRDAHHRFVDIIRSRGADNVEVVFHANFGHPLSLAEWYPGDAYADWVATSIFALGETGGLESESAFGAEHGKPMIVVESAPTAEKYRPDNVDYPEVWEEWFEPYFDFVTADANTKAFVYIGIDWGAYGGNFSHWGNTRVQENPDLLGRYTAELADGIYLHNIEFWQLYSGATTGVRALAPPGEFAFHAPYPNPFGSSTAIDLSLPSDSDVLVQVFDLLGRRVRVLASARLTAGMHTLRWDGRGDAGSRVGSGLYLIDARSQGSRRTATVVLMR